MARVRPTTEALLLATKLQERYTGVHAPLPPHDEVDAPPSPRTRLSLREDGTLDDPQFARLITLLTTMDARTGRPDPSRRPTRG